VHSVWHKARQQLRQTLREASFASLLRENSCMTSGILESTAAGAPRRRS
jgi:DNA-binding IscR family transcriptional regulator